MISKFEIEFLEPAFEFLGYIDTKAREKLIFNIEKAKLLNDPKIFKKLDRDLWEFRAESKKIQYRLIAFWDKRNGKNTLVICTHGFIKKTDKLPMKEMQRARELMKQYLQEAK
jgi:phage-related protein